MPCGETVCVLAGALPAAATASPVQFSIVQDDAIFLGETPHDPEMAIRRRARSAPT